MADKTYTVTVATGQLYNGGGATGNVYYLDGVRDMDLKWTQGATLRFNQDDSQTIITHYYLQQIHQIQTQEE